MRYLTHHQESYFSHLAVLRHSYQPTDFPDIKSHWLDTPCLWSGLNSRFQFVMQLVKAILGNVVVKCVGNG